MHYSYTIKGKILLSCTLLMCFHIRDEPKVPFILRSDFFHNKLRNITNKPQFKWEKFWWFLILGFPQIITGYSEWEWKNAMTDFYVLVIFCWCVYVFLKQDFQNTDIKYKLAIAYILFFKEKITLIQNIWGVKIISLRTIVLGHEFYP